MSHRPPPVEEVFKFHIGNPTKPWTEYRDQLDAIQLELQKEGYQDVDLSDPHDLDKFLYTVLDANRMVLSDMETWNTDNAPKVFRDYKPDFLSQDASGHWQIRSRPLTAFVSDRGVTLERREPQGAGGAALPPPRTP
eukprot:gene4422-1860_t